MNSSMFKRQKKKKKKPAGKKDKRYQNGNIEKGMKIAIDAFLNVSFLVQGISRCIHYPIDFFFFRSSHSVLLFIVFLFFCS